MQQRYRVAIIVLFQLLIGLLPVQAAQAGDTGTVVGSVFGDSNGNGWAEPDEGRVQGAAVYVRSQADPALAFSVETDAGGYFLLRDVPYGVYDVWAIVEGEASPRQLTIEVAEVNAQVLLDVPVSAAAARIAVVRNGALFLPLVATK